MTYVLQRLSQGILVLFGVTTIVFGLTFLSADPVVTLAPLNTTPEALALFRQSMGLDRPVPVQYADFLVHALQGDFGSSFRYHEPAMGVVLERAPATLRLTAVAVAFALLISLPLGTLAALHHDRPIDTIARIVALIGQSIPSFLQGERCPRALPPAPASASRVRR